jgi:hypothetical protein
MGAASGRLLGAAEKRWGGPALRLAIAAQGSKVGVDKQPE